jgi:hypothetical protein
MSVAHLTLTRDASNDEGTYGKITKNGEKVCYTIELPDNNNKQNVSSIPTGTYTCTPFDHPKLGKCYRVNNVPGRDGILIHKGNWAGDTRKGYRSDVLGCILVGNKQGSMNLPGKKSQKAVEDSAGALNSLLDNFPNGFKLTIE